MSYFRTLRTSDFGGKTIKHVNAEAVNVVRFEFTDGTKLDVWAETGPHGIPTMGVFEFEEE